MDPDGGPGSAPRRLTGPIHQKGKRSAVILAAALLLVAALSRAEGPDASNLALTFDKGKDQLSLDARQASLSLLLKKLSEKTGIKTSMDPEAEKPVSVTINKLETREALKYLAETAGLNYALYFGVPDGTGKARVTGMRIIWSGAPGHAPPPQPPALQPSPLQPAAAHQEPQRAPAVSTQNPASPFPEPTMPRGVGNYVITPEDREMATRMSEERQKARAEREAARARRREERLRAGAPPED